MSRAARLLVISPHCDDGVFGCSDLIAGHPGAVVLTVFAGAAPPGRPVTRWDAAAGFKDGDDVMAARRAEDRAALAVLGARPCWLPFRDAQYGPSPRPEAIAPGLVAALAAVEPAVVLAPLGLFHTDHRLAHEALARAAAVGGFEPRFFLGGEEALVAIDLAARGWRLAYAPDVIVHHHPSPRGEAPARRRRWLLRNALWCAWLRRPAPDALRASVALLRAHRGVRVSATLAALAGASWVVRHRRVAPPAVQRALRRVERAGAG